MNCYNCGATLSEVSFCTNCKRDVTLYKKIVYRSNRLYNDGLEKASVRDLSGAIVSLRQSLRLNKENIDARNLLGLIYYEMGEMAEALREWIISSNFRDAGNMASEYIGMIQEDHAGFDMLKRSARDYNGALEMCRQGNKDLAIIRLKKLLSGNSRYVKAHQLLALLYMDSSQFDKAEKEISYSLSIDRTNTLSLRYLHEIQNATEGTENERRSIFSKDEEPIRYVEGNELIIQPANVREPRSGSFGTVFNILIGLVLGLAVMYFLVLPTRISTVRDEVKEDVESLQANLDKRNADYDALMQDLNDVNNERLRLEATVAEYTGEQGTIADIERVIDAANLFMEGTDNEAVAEMLWDISRTTDPTKLSEGCSKLYKSTLAAVSPLVADLYAQKAATANYSGDYNTCSLLYEKAYFFNNNNSDLIYYSAVSYQKAGDKIKAMDLFRFVQDTYPGTYIGEMSAKALKQLEEEDG